MRVLKGNEIKFVVGGHDATCVAGGTPGGKPNMGSSGGTSTDTTAKEPSCLVPAFDGVLFTPEWKDALWDRFYTAAPKRQRQFAELYKIVKRA